MSKFKKDYHSKMVKTVEDIYKEFTNKKSSLENELLEERGSDI